MGSCIGVAYCFVLHHLALYVEYELFLAYACDIMLSTLLSQWPMLDVCWYSIQGYTVDFPSNMLGFGCLLMIIIPSYNEVCYMSHPLRDLERIKTNVSWSKEHSDEDTTHWVLTFGILAIGQGRSQLEGCMKPTRPIDGAAHKVFILMCIARTQMDEDCRICSNLEFHLPCKFITDSVKYPET
jgi:hypothetical protein